MLPKYETVKVRIPAGVDTGSRVIVRSKGEAGPKNASPGDLYIITNVAPHRIHAQGRQHLLRRSHHAARGGAGREDRGADS